MDGLLGVDFNVGVSFDILRDKLRGASPSIELFLNSDLDFSLLVVLKFKPPPPLLSQSESSTSKNENNLRFDLLMYKMILLYLLYHLPIDADFELYWPFDE